jgi:hypothetical protein
MAGSERRGGPAPGVAGTGLLPGGGPAGLSGWALLEEAVRWQVPWLSSPVPGGAGECDVCRQPLRAATRCYPCTEQAESLPGLVADAVLPVCFAPKGGLHARHLWLYKSGQPGAGAARLALLALLAVFLRDHGRCVWAAAGMTAPTHVAAVPSGRARPGAHPLRALAGPLLRLPWAELAAASPGDPAGRLADPGRFVAAPLPGARVALLDDTWTTGASAQSAAAVLRLAGAQSVAVIVLGRHLLPGPALPHGLPRFEPRRCGVHLRPAPVDRPGQ